MTIEDARAYVGTSPASGAAQYALLKVCGLEDDDEVVEYGAGCLHLARILVRVLPPGYYVGVEPNAWLVKAGMDADPDAGWGQASFWGADDFHEPPGFADVVFAHSVLAHASVDQALRLFDAAYRLDARLVVASYREAEETDAPDWRYPDVTWFDRTTLQAIARDAGWEAEVRPDLRAFYSSLMPDEVHDWLVARRT